MTTAASTDYRPSVLWSEDLADRMLKLGEEKAEEYQSNQPFPHIVIDDFLPEEALEPVLENFPSPEQIKWQKFANEHEKKLAFANAEKTPPPIREVLFFLNSAPVLGFLERMTGIDGIITDPYFEGGGLHQIPRGGKLDVHADFNRLPKLRLDRRINLLVYLNKDWKEEYGGHIELWDTEMKQCAKKVLPIFNRCLVFSTTSTSYHGHPEELTCPEGWTRKSLALYYYSNGRPEEEVSESHTTIFKSRPGDQPVKQSGGGVKSVVKKLVPPIFVDMYKGMKGGSNGKH